MEYHNNLNSVVKTIMKSHESIIRNVCSELNVQDETIINDIIKKLLDTSFSSVKPKKDPNRVKRAKSGYLFFCEDKRKQVQIDNPGKNMGDISKVLGKLWKETSEEDKLKYNDLHEEDVERYENEK
jgi:ABC-type transporter MlaC component